MHPIPLPELIAGFLTGYDPPARAKTTCRLMRQTLRELAQDSAVTTSADLLPEALWRWMKRYPTRTPITASTHLRNLRTFCNHAVGRGCLTASPFSYDVKLAKAAHVRKSRRRRHHSLLEIGTVLGLLRDRAARSCLWEDQRLHALAAVVAYTGARAKEAQWAEVADFDLAEGVFLIEPKPNHPLKTESSEREVPIPPPLSAILRRWLPRARSPWAFPGVRRQGPWDGGAPGYRPVDRLRQAGLDAGVRGFTFLSLRHSYVTHGSGAWGMGPGSIQQIAGHSLQDTQKHYLGRDRDNLRAAVASIKFPVPAPIR